MTWDGLGPHITLSSLAPSDPTLLYLASPPHGRRRLGGQEAGEGMEGQVWRVGRGPPTIALILPHPLDSPSLVGPRQKVQEQESMGLTLRCLFQPTVFCALCTLRGLHAWQSPNA